MNTENRKTAAIVLQLARLGLQMTADLEAVLAEPGIARNTTLWTLIRLRLSGPLRPIELMETTGLTRGGMTKVIDQLEESGLVERFADPEDSDQRSIRARLTPAGEKAVRDVLDVMEPAIDEFVEELRAILETDPV